MAALPAGWKRVREDLLRNGKWEIERMERIRDGRWTQTYSYALWYRPSPGVTEPKGGPFDSFEGAVERYEKLTARVARSA